MNGSVRLAQRDLRALWRETAGMDAISRREALEDAWPLLMLRYGDLTATVAADLFEEETRLPAVLAAPATADALNERLRWGLGPLFGGDGPLAARDRLLGLADELVKQPGRDTVIDSAARNKIRFARVPTGARTCEFCLVLAGRGAVYRTPETAGALRTFHRGCDCRIEAIVTDADMTRLRVEAGYNPEALAAEYQRNRRSTLKGTLAAMRKARKGN